MNNIGQDSIKKYIRIILLPLILFNLTNCEKQQKVDPDIRVKIEKTFDQGILIDHELTVQNSKHKVFARFSQRREAEGSEKIISSRLVYRHKHPGHSGSITPDEQKLFLQSILNSLIEKFGKNLKLNRFSSRKYLGAKATEKKAILAFKDFDPWKNYIKDHNRYTQRDIYQIVISRWKEKNVFSNLTDAFRELGYSLELDRFEKLFIFNAGGSPFYNELKKLGIKKEDGFPYPGFISFTVKNKITI